MNIVVEITRELDKKSLLNCYPIYINYRWSMLELKIVDSNYFSFSCVFFISIFISFIFYFGNLGLELV